MKDVLSKIKKFFARLIAVFKTRFPGRRVDSDHFSLVDFAELNDPDIFAKTKGFYSFIEDMKRKGFFSYRRALRSPCKNRVVIFDEMSGKEKEMIMMASNNYLGLTTHPKVIEAGIKAYEKYGSAGSSAPLLSGTFDLTKELEAKLAKFKHCADAVVFSTGYSANVGLISALVRHKDVAIIDKLDHASIVDGCKMSGADFKVFHHGDMQNLEKVLESCKDKYYGKLLLTDGVFGMDGDICPLPQIRELARRYGARVMVDDAHATGVIGKCGRGTAEYFGMEGEIDLVMGTFSKTLGGVGGFVASSQEVINYIRFYARSYFFSAALPPCVCATVKAAIEVIEAQPELIEQLHSNVLYLHDRLATMGYEVNPPASGVLTVIIGEDMLLRRMSKRIHELGLYVNPLPYPSVPKDKSRFKFSLMATHTKDDLDETARIMEKAGREFKVIK